MSALLKDALRQGSSSVRSGEPFDLGRCKDVAWICAVRLWTLILPSGKFQKSDHAFLSLDARSIIQKPHSSSTMMERN